MNRFVKIFVRASSLLLILKALQPAIFASVDDAQSFALQAAEPVDPGKADRRPDQDRADGDGNPACGRVGG